MLTILFPKIVRFKETNKMVFKILQFEDIEKFIFIIFESII